jgi:UDP-N-acetylmuramate dehydrogenase
MFPDITADLKGRMPELRGRLEANAPTAPLSWFRTGGPAQVLFTPLDAGDLAYFLQGLDRSIPVLVVGLGSNLLIRDGGWEGVVIRLGKGFAEMAVEPGHRVRAGAGAPT